MDKKLLEKVVKEKQIASIIKSGDLGGLYFIFGNDNQLKVYYANEIAKNAVDKDFTDFNLHKFDGTTVFLESIQAAVDAMPMFSKGTCVLINDLPINNMLKCDYDNLKLILNNIPSTCSFILLMDTIEKKKIKTSGENNSSPSDKKEDITEKKVDMWDEILEIALLQGLAVELNNRPTSSLAGQLIKKAADKGHKIDENTAIYLIESVGNDIANLNNELDKICDYAQGEIITAGDIDAVAVKTIEIRIYEMVNSLIAGNIDSAHQMLYVLLAQKIEPVIILGTLISPFVDMYRVKTAVQAGFRPEDSAGYFDYYKKDFKLKNLTGIVKRMSIVQISRCLDFLDEADTIIKTTALDKHIVVEQTMIRITSVLC